MIGCGTLCRQSGKALHPLEHLDLYNRLAAWWPLISPPELYREEARRIAHIVDTHARCRQRSILILGGGGGCLASWLRRRRNVTIADISLPMLQVSRRLNPGCIHVLGDMRTLRLPRRYAAVVIPDSVSYLRTAADIVAAARTALWHCALGGVAVFQPEYVAETFREDRYSAQASDGNSGLTLTRTTSRHPGRENGYYSRFEYVLTSQNGTEQWDEIHEFGLAAIADWLSILERSGFRDVQALRYERADGLPEQVSFFGVRRE